MSPDRFIGTAVIPLQLLCIDPLFSSDPATCSWQVQSGHSINACHSQHSLICHFYIWRFYKVLWQRPRVKQEKKNLNLVVVKWIVRLYQISPPISISCDLICDPSFGISIFFGICVTVLQSNALNHGCTLYFQIEKPHKPRLKAP